MNDQLRYIRIFLSSPGDVAEERLLALSVIDQLPYKPAFRDRLAVRVVAWDKPGAGTPLLANMTPQEAINQSLPKPSECDIVIVIFWTRMGTPLPDEYRKLDGSRFLSGTEWEYEDALASAREQGKPLVVIYRRMQELTIALNDPKRAEKIAQWERVEAFFNHFTHPDGSIKQGYNSYASPDDFRSLLEGHLESLVVRLLEDSSEPRHDSTLNPVVTWKGSPFPGLRSFTAEDAHIFFGRGRETDSLLEHMRHTRFVTVVGASGSGKSSLIGAGIIPRLNKNAITGSKDWIILRFAPGEMGDNPFLALAVQLAPLVRRVPRDLSSELSTNPERIEAVAEHALADQPDWAEILLFIDQFEELFTVVRPELRQAFINLLVIVAASRRLRAVLTLRADFYHRCVEWPELAELLRDGSFPLAAPGRIALYEMITRPAERALLEFEDGLAERIIEDTGSEPGALALMAYTLDELYQARVENRLTHQAYDSLGKVQGAIGQRAEHVFSQLGAEAQAVLPYVFRHLVEVDERGVATRQRALYSKIAETEAARHLINALTEARLLVQSADREQAIVEVAHEALLQSWPRLANWIEDTRGDLRLLRQVKVASREWDHQGRDPAFLWPDERLKRVYAMIERLQPELDETVQNFIRSELDRLMEEIQQSSTSHQRRSAIGERLSLIGDTRLGVGLRSDRLPDITWCAVPGGSVKLRDTGVAFPVEPFFIARYPVTFIQFQAFIDAPDGYNRALWWHGLAQRETNLGQQNFQFVNHPHENVNWYEAVAFCRWLTSKYHSAGEALPLDGAVIRLPTEWEWQQAATGGKVNYDYPWGSAWDANRANTAGSGLNRTTAVGMYPLGASPTGALDLSGNLWEWCLNDADTFKTDLTGEARRVLRGGSWDDSHDLASTLYRDWFDPMNRSSLVGFRVCLAAPIE